MNNFLSLKNHPKKISTLTYLSYLKNQEKPSFLHFFIHQFLVSFNTSINKSYI